MLQERGEAALKAAIAIAESGRWPAAVRAKLTLPPARFIENAYADQPYPDVEHRILAAARVWGVFHYFHPYRHLYDEDWNAVFKETLPKVEQAANAREYHRAIAEMVAHTRDSHVQALSDVLWNEVYGVTAPPPIEVRWIENQPVVTRVFDVEADVRPGDVVTKIDGQPFQKRIEELRPTIAASTPQGMMRPLMQALLRGPDASVVRIAFRRGNGAEHEFSFTRKASLGFFPPPRTGDAYRLITPKIGYVDLILLKNEQVDEMLAKLAATDAIVLDMRGYPNETAWALAPRLAERQGAVAAVFRRNVAHPDVYEGDDERDSPTVSEIPSLLFEQRLPVTTKPRYSGKTVMLIDERAMSQSEHSGLFYRAANGTKFIGSPTIGANGDVTRMVAPGGIYITFTGQDVRWPDGKQLQRVGLMPDIEVRPTIAGIRDGRDEVLDRAVEYLSTGR